MTEGNGDREGRTQPGSGVYCSHCGDGFSVASGLAIDEGLKLRCTSCFRCCLLSRGTYIPSFTPSPPGIKAADTGFFTNGPEMFTSTHTTTQEPT
ncbi:MAG: hypothetical protein EOO38_01640, partial [Cytophagaceae bacterium]